jgi:menaquinone-dependent protoporphyrinogen oxidase
MARVLIVYGTAYGQTERIAHELARVLRESEHEVSPMRGDRLPPGTNVEKYDAIVVAASVLVGRHQRYIERFAREHAARLNAVPSAFVSVCGAMANPAPEGERAAAGYRERFLAAAGWRPSLARSFAGGLPYTRYRPWVRWMMRMISYRTGAPTDTSRDHDFTDWRAVAELAREFARLLPAGRDAPPHAAATAGGPRSDLDELC